MLCFCGLKFSCEFDEGVRYVELVYSGAVVGIDGVFRVGWRVVVMGLVRGRGEVVSGFSDMGSTVLQI